MIYTVHILLFSLYKNVSENTTNAGVIQLYITESKGACNKMPYIMPYAKLAISDAANLLFMILLNPKGKIIHNRNGMIITSFMILNTKPISKVILK